MNRKFPETEERYATVTVTIKNGAENSAIHHVSYCCKMFPTIHVKLWKETIHIYQPGTCKIMKELLFLQRTNPIEPMSKTVIIAPANLVLQPTTVSIPAHSASPSRKTIVLIPQPARSGRS